MVRTRTARTQKRTPAHAALTRLHPPLGIPITGRFKQGKSQSKLSPEDLADLQKNTYCQSSRVLAPGGLAGAVSARKRQLEVIVPHRLERGRRLGRRRTRRGRGHDAAPMGGGSSGTGCAGGTFFHLLKLRRWARLSRSLVGLAWICCRSADARFRSSLDR